MISDPSGEERAILHARDYPLYSAKIFPWKPQNDSFIDQACSVMMVRYYPHYFFASLWTSTSSPSINMQKMDLANIQPSWPHTSDLSNRTVRQSNPIKHQSFDCRTHSNIIKLTIKFCQSNTIERSITERLVIEPNRTFDYRTNDVQFLAIQ